LPFPPETKKVLLLIRLGHEGGKENSILGGAAPFVKRLQSGHTRDERFQPAEPLQKPSMTFPSTQASFLPIR
jgi:hypothetical protein